MNFSVPKISMPNFEHGIVHFIKSRFFLRFVFMFIILIIVALSTTSISILSVSKQAIIKTQSKNYIQMVQFLKNETNKFIESKKSWMWNIRKGKKFKDKNMVAVGSHMFDLVRKDPELIKMVLFDREGNILSQASTTHMGALTKVKSPEYFKEAADVNYKLRMFTKYVGKQVFVAVPVRYSRNRYIHSIGAYYSFSSVAKFGNQLSDATKLEVEIVDEDNYSFIFRKRYKESKYIESLKKLTKDFVRLKIEGTPYVAAAMKDPLYKFTYIIKQKEKIALAGVRKGQRRAIMVLGIATLIFLIIGVILSNIVARPLKKVHYGLTQFREGNLDHKVRIHTIDEFGQLARTLNDMSSDIKSLMSQQGKAEQLSMISHLAVSLNHEVKNPLAVVSMASGIIKRLNKEIENDKIGMAIDMMEQSVSKITELIVNVSKITEPVLEDYVDGQQMLKINFASGELDEGAEGSAAGGGSSGTKKKFTPN
jgi:methyl-accepting chemotaxis protein